MYSGDRRTLKRRKEKSGVQGKGKAVGVEGAKARGLLREAGEIGHLVRRAAGPSPTLIECSLAVV